MANGFKQWPPWQEELQIRKADYLLSYNHDNFYFWNCVRDFAPIMFSPVSCTKCTTETKKYIFIWLSYHKNKPKQWVNEIFHIFYKKFSIFGSGSVFYVQIIKINRFILYITSIHTIHLMLTYLIKTAISFLGCTEIFTIFWFRFYKQSFNTNWLLLVLVQL